MDDLQQALALQDGVIARRQARAAGLSDTAIARRLRRREWVVAHPGVYVDHTGPLTWRQRAWAAVLACWPAALDGWSALRVHEGPGRVERHGGPGDDGPIWVVVANDRRIRAPAGVRVRRSRRFAEAAQTNLAPPRLRYEDVILDLADRATNDLAAVAILADACGGRRTTADRLRKRLAERARVRRRDWLGQLLADIAAGVCSVLEHRFLNAVERAHGLPPGRRQVAETGAGGRRAYRDVVYGGRRLRWRQPVELDGRLGHDTTRERDADLERDLASALDGDATIRLGYGQVFSRPCTSAAVLAQLFRRHGWRSTPHACPDCPADVRRLFATWNDPLETQRGGSRHAC